MLSFLCIRFTCVAKWVVNSFLKAVVWGTILVEQTQANLTAESGVWILFELVMKRLLHKVLNISFFSAWMEKFFEVSCQCWKSFSLKNSLAMSWKMLLCILKYEIFLFLFAIKICMQGNFSCMLWVRNPALMY